MKICNPICLLYFLVVSGSVSYIQAQDNYLLKTFTTDNGLPHNFIQSIAQDQTGFIWIATWDGLSRFDGYEFKNYYHNPGDSASFPFFITDKVLVDRLNNVWIFSLGRPTVIYDRIKDCFHPFYFTPKPYSRPSDLAIGSDKNVWQSSGASIYQYNLETNRIKSFRIIDNANKELISYNNGPQLAWDNLGGLWIYYSTGSSYNIFKCTLLNDSTLVANLQGSLGYSQFESSGYHNTTGNFDIYISQSGKTWLFCRYGLFHLDQSKGLFIENNKPVDCMEFKGRQFFVWTDDKTGIHIINTKSNSLINFKPENGNFTEAVYIDKSGIIWSGDVNPSREGIGLKMYLKIPQYFKHYLVGKNENNSGNLVFPIIKDKYEDLWVGIRYLDYLFRIKPDGTQEKVKLTNHSVGTNNPTALSMVEDSGGIWIGASGGQLIYYDFLKKEMSIRFPDKNNTKTESPRFHNLLKINDSLIINGGKGIYRFIPVTNSLNLLYKHHPEGNAFSLVNDGQNGYWLGTHANTVIHLDQKLNRTNEFKVGREENLVEHICVGDSNDIWVALMGGGLGHLYPASGKTEIFTTADGLSNNVTYSILKDSRGDLWISTNQGISRFNPHTKNFRNFGKAEGLLISEFNSDSYFQSLKGEMFFGGVGGMVGFNPDSINSDRSANSLTPLIITDFKVSGITRHFKRAVFEMDTLTLEKGDNNFQLTFACLDFKNPEKIKYHYRLAGNNKAWIETDYRNRKINYANLTHTDYTLEIEATGESGDWVNKKSVLIRIPHRITEILWIRLLIIILLSSAFLFLGLIYIRQIKLKARHVQDQLRLVSLRGQMNPHFIFNSLNSINYFISKEDKLSANRYIADFSRLIRSILSNLSSDYIPLDNELESLRDYLRLEHLRFGDKFNYCLNTDKIINGNEISVFPGLVQPFIENAIWHGVRGLENRKGFIQIEFVQVSSVNIQCIIEDDGIGRRMAESIRNDLPGHESRGIGIVQERLRIINNLTKSNYQLKIADLYPDKSETGTSVTIDLPVRIINNITDD